MPDEIQKLTRRTLLAAPIWGLACATAAHSAPGNTDIAPQLRQRALEAMVRHRAAVPNTDLMGIVDFSKPSARPRFHLLDLHSGQVQTLLVAHGRGSDPDHSGWLKRFSNAEGSYASSPGAYVTDEIYNGKHGRSLRLNGLDDTNSNAKPRAIVVHAAWYVSPSMARDAGKLGRSEGCFAVAQTDLEPVLTRLGRGRMIYADKV